MVADDGLEILDTDECRRLLATQSLGRVGVSVGALPAIFPVNYALVDHSIVFRTGEGSKLSAATEGAVVAFEVDAVDFVARYGWSVLVVGTATHDQNLAAMDLVDPWPSGARQHLIRIGTDLISGRRIRRP